VKHNHSATRLFDVMLALFASLLLCVLPMSRATAGQIELVDILDVDPLGYQCVPSQFFEEGEDGSAAVAFSLSGKTRLPRTCLPDPCARALSRNELSQLTGTSPMLARFSEEWDDYYARYADHCVREVTVSRPRDAFWKPIIQRAQTTQRVGVPTSSRRLPFIPSVNVPSAPRIPTAIAFDAGGRLETGGLAGPSPVPIPASGALLLVAFGGAAYAARRKRPRKSVSK